MEEIKGKYIWGLLRISFGLVFLWAFVDKVFGLGFNTCTDPKTGKFIAYMCKSAWINGASPTFGFLKFATKGPFAAFYQELAGNPVIDWLFMMGLLLIGLTLLLGIGVKIAGYSGALMYLFMYTAGFIPPVHHPFIDEHIINLIIMTGFTRVGAGQWLGLGKWWANTPLVRRFSFLQ